MTRVSALLEKLAGRLRSYDVVTFGGEQLFTRYELLREDEWPDSWWDAHRAADPARWPTRPCGLPWWLPFNVFLHRWCGAVSEEFHDHPRWSVSICLAGSIIERTPWGERTLRPGSIVVRSRKAIHAFEAIDVEAVTWTLFIVGRRRHRQNTYQVVRR